MLRNMTMDLFRHERIITTRARGKVLKSYAEKLITRAKRNLNNDASPESRLHNKREVMRVISDRDIVVKLFEDLAGRYRERNGGYTRMIHLPERSSDSAQMSIVELVDRKEKVRRERAGSKAAPQPEPPKGRGKKASKKADDETAAAPEAPDTAKKDDKDTKKKKWFWGFKKKRGDDH